MDPLVAQIARHKPAKRLRISGHQEFVKFQQRAHWTRAERHIAVELLEHGAHVLGYYLERIRRADLATASEADDFKSLAEVLSGVWAEYSDRVKQAQLGRADSARRDRPHHARPTRSLRAGRRCSSPLEDAEALTGAGGGAQRAPDAARPR